MFCDQCGARNAAGSRFCLQCGAPLASAPGGGVPDGTLLDDASVPSAHGAVPMPAAAAVPPAPSPAPVPMPVSADSAAPGASEAAGASVPPAVVPPAPGGSGSGDGGAVAAGRGRAPLIVGIVLAVLVVVGGLAAFFTYRNEVWGGKTLPDPASVASEVKDADGGKSSVVKAKDVTAALEAKGLKTRTEKVFSGADSGTFVGCRGV